MCQSNKEKGERGGGDTHPVKSPSVNASSDRPEETLTATTPIFAFFLIKKEGKKKGKEKNVKERKKKKVKRPTRCTWMGAKRRVNKLILPLPHPSEWLDSYTKVKKMQDITLHIASVHKEC